MTIIARRQGHMGSFRNKNGLDRQAIDSLKFDDGFLEARSTSVVNSTIRNRHNGQVNETLPVLYNLAPTTTGRHSAFGRSSTRTGFKTSYHEAACFQMIRDDHEVKKTAVTAHTRFEQPSILTSVTVYLVYTFLVLWGYLRDFLRATGFERNRCYRERPEMRDFVPLFSDFESFFTRNLYVRVRDCWNRPIAGVPGAKVLLKDRYTNDGGWTFRDLSTTTEVINMGSYNYLGFAENKGKCASEAKTAIRKLGIHVGCSRQQFGTTVQQRELETLVAEFLGTEDAMCFPMGFATNSTNIPSLVGTNSLILSDELNHTSLILGSRLSGATVQVFKHNDTRDLERKLRNAIAYGNKKTRKPYAKIFICVEGVYSMEGSIVPLPDIIALKKKYNAYLYLDEAHSIGALGKSGRGVCEYWSCNPRDVDVLMGTFTKSFGSAGGYIAGCTDLINYLRTSSQSGCHGNSMSPPIAQQIKTSLSIILGRDGTNNGRQRIDKLAENSRYFRQKLVQAGYIIYGDDSSPIVPLLTYYPTLTCFLSRQLLLYKVGVVAVGFPATPLTQARIRFCLSASHTKEMLDKVIEDLQKCSELTSFKFSRQLPSSSTVDDLDVM